MNNVETLTLRMIGLDRCHINHSLTLAELKTLFLASDHTMYYITSEDIVPNYPIQTLYSIICAV